VIAVVGVAAYSGWKLARKQDSIAGLRSSSYVVGKRADISWGDLLNGIAVAWHVFWVFQNTFCLLWQLVGASSLLVSY